MVGRASDSTAGAATALRVRRLVSSILAARSPEAIDALILLLEIFAAEDGDDRLKIDLAESAIEEAYSHTDRFAYDLKGYRELLKVGTEGRF